MVKKSGRKKWCDEKNWSFNFISRNRLENKVLVHYTARETVSDTKSYPECVLTSYVVGADGANSEVAKQEIKNSSLKRLVFAYHEIIQRPEKASENYEPNRCDVIYSSKYSPDFYSWVFPHGDTFSIGTGSTEGVFF